ncbi:MAG: M6 family metalloprotease domain-containing protein [Candidatus Krumholzibacteriia bacterium]
MRSSGSVLASCVFAVACLIAQTVSAVPANPELRQFTQPGGSAFSARLIGDEWMHWYETDAGHTILRDPDGLWVYAELDAGGHLVPSSLVVDRDAPRERPHLRQSTHLLDEMAIKAQAIHATKRAPMIESITGVQDIVIILVEFSDTGTGEGSMGPRDAAHFADPVTGLVLGSNSGKMAHYFDEVSYGQLTLQGVAANGIWHRSDRTELYYSEDCSPGQPCDYEYDVPGGVDNCNACIYDLARHAIQMADTTGFDFSPYDLNGDGVIDHVMIVHAGQNQASYGGGPDDIWSHWGTIPGGEPVGDKVVHHYMMLSEHDAMSAFAHEFTHQLGAPDLYDYDGDADPVGRWCNMGFNFETERPPHLCGLLKIDVDADFSNGMTGWVTPVPLNADSTYTALRLDQNAEGSVFMSDPNFSGNEYFLVENRSRSGFYDYSVPGSGIILTHVDMDMPNGTGRFNDGPPNNSYHGAWIERPLNLASPDGAAYSADAGEHQFTPTTIPNTNANGNVGTGHTFWGIDTIGDAMDFRFRSGPTYVSGTTTGSTLWALENSPFVINGNLTVSSGDTLTIEPGVVVKLMTNISMTINGALIAIGTAEDRIVITSYKDDDHGGDTNGDGPSSGAPGDWNWLWFLDADTGCQMQHCVVRYGGRSYLGLDVGPWRYTNPSIYLSGTGTSLSMSNCLVEFGRPRLGTSSSYGNAAICGLSGTNLQISESVIRNNGYYGIYTQGALTLLNSQVTDNGHIGAQSDASGAIVRNCRITGNSSTGLYLAASGAQVVADTLMNNGGDGLYCPNLPSAFSENISVDNAGWGFRVPSDIVHQIWTTGEMSGNGRGNAINVYAGSIPQTTIWIDEHAYYVSGNITVPNQVTWNIEPGAILKMNSNTSVTIDGTLIANGTAEDRIVITSYKDDDHGGDTNGDGPSSGAPGDWNWLWFLDADAGCQMQHCVVRYGGQSYLGYDVGPWRYTNPSIYLSGTGTSLSMSNCLVEFGRPRLSAHSNYGNAAICGLTGTNLQISESVIRNNGYYGIYTQGALTLLNSQVTDNGHIGAQSNASGAIVRNCRITGNSSTGLYLDAGGAQVVADTLLNNGGHGLQLNQLPVQFSDNRAADNNMCGFVLPTQIITQAWQSGNQVQTDDPVGVLSGNIPAGTLWIDEHPYCIFGDITIPSDIDLALESGAILKFSGGYGLTVNGRLLANGTGADPIVFTSYRDDTYGGDTNGDGSGSGVHGDWRNITFTNTNAGSSMQYCRMRFAGSAYGLGSNYREALVMSGTGASLTMTDCLVERTGGSTGSFPYAVRVNAGSDFQFINSEIRDNEGHGLWCAEPSALISGCLATGNGQFGFYMHPNLVGEIANDNTQTASGWDNSIGMMAGSITQDDEWPDTYTYVMNGTTTIASGATLILHKGTVVKFNGAHSLVVNGGLYALGDPVKKVVLTSFKDDNYGGDTNLDGVNTIPAAGDWGRIHFNGAHSGSLLGWAVISYGGSGNVPALTIDNAVFNGSFNGCIVRNNLGRAVSVGLNAELTFTHCDVYENAFGLENLNTAATVDARGVWWGHASGPGGVGEGLGNGVSDNVLFDPWLSRSIDNPWVSFNSPTTTGNYTSVVIFDLDGDPLLDLATGTASNGLEIYRRTGFESWEAVASPITSGQVLALDVGDFNGDDQDDLVVGTATGIRVFAGDGQGGLTEVAAPLSGPGVSDVKFAHVNHDMHLDIIAASVNNGGIWVFHGDGTGYWTTGQRPIMTNTYNKIAAADLNNDSYLDIVATNAEYLGIHIWYGAADGTWTQGAPLGSGQAFYGLDLGDIDKNGFYDIAAGSDITSVGISVFLNDGDGIWSPLAGPVTTGRFGDIRLADLNNDGRLDLAASNLFGGVNVWIGTSNLHWNYWYHPATTNIYKALCVADFTLNGSLDLAAASTVHGLALWDNVTPGVFQEYFSLTPDNFAFGRVAIGKCAHETFELTNVTDADTLRNVIVYTTNAAFTISEVAKEVGPFDLLPGEARTMQVAYCPTQEAVENEVVIIHCTQTVSHVRVSGEGVPFIEPIWAVDLDVANALGGPGNSGVLTFGAAIGATDSLDVQSGEVALPPLPPSSIFDARFQALGTEGSLVNIHDYYNIEDAFTMQWQPGDAGYPVTVSWNPGSLPSGTFLIGTALKDTLDMAAVSEYIVPVGMEYITELTVWTTVLSSFTHELNGSWQIVSRPIATESDSLSVLFPSARSAFGFDGNYVQAHLLAKGRGFWLDMPADTTVVHTGNQVRRIQLSLPAGWSMIGAPYNAFAVADIAQSPPGAIQSVFGYNLGYHQVSELQPGQGYWIDLSMPSTITIDLDAFKRAADKDSDPLASAAPVDAAAETVWEMPLVVRPTSGAVEAQLVLLLGAAVGATGGCDTALGEVALPPVPPSNIFDARLVSAGSNGLLRDLRDADADLLVYEVAWQGHTGRLPVTLSWQPDMLPADCAAALTDTLGGSILGRIDMKKRDTFVIDEALAALEGIRIEINLTSTQNDLPTVLALHPCVPNPFNPMTTIHYDLPVAGQVELQVFDLAGRRVRVLVSEKVEAGRHQVIWDGRNDTGARVASGTYIYRLNSQSTVLNRKMTLVK